MQAQNIEILAIFQKCIWTLAAMWVNFHRQLFGDDEFMCIIIALESIIHMSNWLIIAILRILLGNAEGLVHSKPSVNPVL